MIAVILFPFVWIVARFRIATTPVKGVIDVTHTVFNSVGIVWTTVDSGLGAGFAGLVVAEKR